MNRKNNAKQSPAYPLGSTYALVLAYWQQQIALGNVKIGKVEAMQAMIIAGANALGVTPLESAPKQKRAVTKQATARVS